jgi:hypothetical protein
MVFAVLCLFLETLVPAGNRAVIVGTFLVFP